MTKSRASRPYQVLFHMVIGKWISQALGTIVEIGVPEQLAKGARRCSDIAREAGVSEDGMYRLLRALASVGLFVESGDRRFKLTGMGQLLRTDHPESLAGYARFVAHDSTWRPWGQLGYSVKTGMPAFDHVFNVPIFDYLAESRSRLNLRRRDDINQRYGGPSNVRCVRLQRSPDADGR